ncbi:MAG: hypothetical protein ACP5QI_05475, partial [Candidatus Bathyarchaeia archaeon]
RRRPNRAVAGSGALQPSPSMAEARVALREMDALSMVDGVSGDTCTNDLQSPLTSPPLHLE